MDASRKQAILFVLLVPVSSLLGLAKAMGEAGPEVFREVWSANLWGDVAFTCGTIAAAWLVTRLMTRADAQRPAALFGLAVPGSFVLHWAVYALSWTLTGSSEGDGFLSFEFAQFPDAWLFTLEWGWPGLLAMALLGPAASYWCLAKPARPAPATMPVVPE